jgi:hypothetical protein
MAEKSSGGSSVNIVAIVAILLLIGGAGWYFMGQRSPTAATNAPASEEKADFTVKVDLPDSVTIK